MGLQCVDFEVTLYNIKLNLYMKWFQPIKTYLGQKLVGFSSSHAPIVSFESVIDLLMWTLISDFVSNSRNISSSANPDGLYHQAEKKTQVATMKKIRF